MTQTAATPKVMTDGQKLEFKDHLTTFMEKMADEFDSMNWGTDIEPNDLLLGGPGMMATTLHATLLTSFAVMLKAGCPKIHLGKLVLEAVGMIPDLQKDLLEAALMGMMKEVGGS